MKKLFVVILAFLYISTSSGAVLHFHYCMGKLTDWGLNNQEPGKCSKCGMEKKANKCCKDEHKFFKNNTDQKAAASVYQSMQVSSVVVPTSFLEISTVHFLSVTEENPISHAPPRNCGVAVYIRNCVFLI